MLQRWTIYTAVLLTLCNLAGCYLECLAADPLTASEKPQPLPVPSEGYFVFEFPEKATLAVMKYQVNYIDQSGKARERSERVVAKGRVRLPKLARITIKLRYDAIDNMRYFEDLKKCHVIAIDASSLDFDDTHMQCIKDFKELEELDLKDTLITDKSLPIVGSFHNLKSLMLTRTNVTGEGLKYLVELKKLQTLYINYLHLKKGTVAQLAPILPQLSVVNFGTIGLSKDEAKTLALLSNVGNLDLSCDSQIDDDCVKFIAPLKRLGILSIQDTGITDKSLPALRRLPVLDKLYVRSKTFWAGGATATSAGRIKILDPASRSSAPIELFAPLH